MVLTATAVLNAMKERKKFATAGSVARELAADQVRISGLLATMYLAGKLDRMTVITATGTTHWYGIRPGIPAGTAYRNNKQSA